MKNQPLVSVIVPIYGVEAYIAQCAESLMAQTYPAIEYIFVNDGTKDRSMEVLAGVLERFPEKNVQIVNQENKGLPQARAAGVRVAKGEFIAHVDSDDWVEPDLVERVVEKAVSTGADFVYYDFWKVHSGYRKLDREKHYETADKELYMRRLYSYLAYGYVWNKFARKSLYQHLFFPKYNMHEDIVIATQLLYRAQHIEQLSVPLVHYRRNNPASVMHEAKKKRRVQSANNMLDMYEYYRENLAGSPVEPVLNDLILRTAWVAYTLDKNLYTERPYLKEMARRLPLMPGRRVNLIQQLILRLYLITSMAKVSRSTGGPALK